MSSIQAMANRGWRRVPVISTAVLFAGLALLATVAVFGSDYAMDVMRLLHAGVDYHPDPSHSFFLGGERSVQCARNTGIYLGAFLTLPWAWVTGRGRATGFPPMRLGMVLALCFGIMVADGVNSLVADLGYRAAYPPNTGLRLGTGLLAGTAAGWYFLPVLNGVLWQQVDERPVNRGVFWMVALWAIELGIWLAVIIEVDWLVVPMAALTSAASLTLFGSVNLLLLILLLRSENRYERVQDLVRLISVAICAATMQLGLLAVLVRLVVAP